MNIVLLSGGSGNRLWPLSTPENSKQFLKILKTDDGRTESMQKFTANLERQSKFQLNQTRKTLFQRLC